jgi:hypothetical protein
MLSIFALSKLRRFEGAQPPEIAWRSPARLPRRNSDCGTPSLDPLDGAIPAPAKQLSIFRKMPALAKAGVESGFPSENATKQKS